MTSPSWIIPHMKALDLKFCIASRLSLATTWWRSRAIRKISKNGFSATPSGRILMIYTLKVHKYYCDSDDVCIMTFWGQKRSNVGQNRQIRVKSDRLVEIYPTYICFDSEFCPEFKFKIFWGQIRSSRGQTWVKAVKLGSNRADKSKCTQYTYGSTPNFVPNTNSKFFEVESGHQEVKVGSKPSN